MSFGLMLLHRIALNLDSCRLVRPTISHRGQSNQQHLFFTGFLKEPTGLWYMMGQMVIIKQWKNTSHLEMEGIF